MLKEGLEKMICPEGHIVLRIRENYAKDFSDNLNDADRVPMYENGFYCHGCKRAYGISKLKPLLEENKCQLRR